MYDERYLVHHGIKGQRWGIRRFQNEDGSLNRAGKVAAGVGVTAVVVGGAYAANKYGGRAIRGAKAARYSAKATTKAHRITKMRRGMGYYKNYKTGVNVTAKFPVTTVNRGSLFVNSSNLLKQSTLGL